MHWCLAICIIIKPWRYKLYWTKLTCVLEMLMIIYNILIMSWIFVHAWQAIIIIFTLILLLIIMKLKIEADGGFIMELGPRGSEDAEEEASLHTEDGLYLVNWICASLPTYSLRHFYRSNGVQGHNVHSPKKCISFAFGTLCVHDWIVSHPLVS